MSSLVGISRHIEANRELLRLPLLGMDPSEYEKLGNDEYHKQLNKESRERALKDKDDDGILHGRLEDAFYSNSNQFFIVLSGRFAIYHNEKKNNEPGPGSMFGEYASLELTVRNATLKSMEKSLVLQIESAKLKSLYTPYLF